MASTYLTRTIGTSTDNNKFTISVWCKRSKLTGDYQAMLDSRLEATAVGLGLFWGNDNSVWYNFSTSTSTFSTVSTNAIYRDVNGWYHIVVAGDTSQSGTDKLKIWVNGEQQTSFNNDDRSSFVGIQNCLGSTTNPNEIGRKYDGTYFLDGSMSHFHFIDGTAYDASAFGQADANGVWTIKTSPSVTYGNNGFFILKDGNSVTDQSGNSNNWTVASGTLTNTEDNPSNVFATVNPLVPSNISSLSNGNTTLTQSTDASAIATLGFQGGKYYWEVKNSNQQSFTQLVGVLRQARMASSGNAGYNIGTNDGSWSYFIQSNQDNGKAFHNNTLTSVLQTTSANDILQVAVDADVGKIWWGVNGTWVNSGDPANGTNAVYTNLPTDDVLFPAFSNYNAGQFQINFGNGYFGTTAVASAGTNASGIGIFEYDVPTGYTALSTKGLNL
jgi:hypothetical protein